MPECLITLAGYLDESGTGLQHPEAMDDKVFLSGMSLIEQQRVVNWADAIRHLWELGATLSSGEHKATLSEILTELSKIKNPTVEQIKDYTQKLRNWMSAAKGYIPPAQRDLYQTIENHLNEVERLLKEEASGEKEISKIRYGVYLPVLDVIISVEDDPIEIIHLGWPKLGGSCLDIVEGTYQTKAASYPLNPAIRVIYIRDKKNPLKPLARVSVGFDPVGKTLVPISPIKVSSPYNFEPLVGKFLEKWAVQLKAFVAAPANLGYTQNLGKNFVSDKRKVSLPKGLLPLYSDLIGETNGWDGTVEGWVFDFQNIKELILNKIEDKISDLVKQSATQRHLLFTIFSVGRIMFKKITGSELFKESDLSEIKRYNIKNLKKIIKNIEQAI